MSQTQRVRMNLRPASRPGSSFDHSRSSGFSDSRPVIGLRTTASLKCSITAAMANAPPSRSYRLGSFIFFLLVVTCRRSRMAARSAGTSECAGLAGSPGFTSVGAYVRGDYQEVQRAMSGLNDLMRRGIVPPLLHGILDYPLAAVLIVLPLVLDFDDPAAKWIAFGL